MNEIFTYDVDVTWLENRKGILKSSVLDEQIEVVTPPEFAKGIPGIWSPEHLFVAAAVSCFMTTFLAIAEKSRLEFIDFSCKSTGILEKKENGLMISSITLQPIVKVPDDSMIEKAQKVLELSHKSCLILNSVKSEIIFMPHIQCDDTVSNNDISR
ncbi:MAG TPA: OsmC family protein [Flavobacterium sp.]|uniref:OsmC family protein n=1 Tax=Flavobacterium sp. TaxID=239 RepID=UPI002CB65DF6|nr:OsmC family protein [Flavobacterium sp.]HNP33537.1 OsmC family protein [Flavobacterium sp.]